MLKKSIITTAITALVIMSIHSSNMSAQGLNAEKVELTNFLTRMYKAEPFEGVKVVTDYDNSYLLSVLTLDKSKYPNQSALNRVAGVKAMSQANQFFNGSSISTDMIIKTVEKSDGTIETEIVENIKENSFGYVKALEQLTSFDDKDGRKVFIYFKKMCDEPAKQLEQ